MSKREYLFGAAVGDWVADGIPGVKAWFKPFTTFGVAIDGEIKGAIVYDCYSGCDINMHIRLDDHRAVTRETIRLAFMYPFQTLKCTRVTGLIPASNEKSRRFAEKIGFVLEGKKRASFQNEDELIFGMTKGECRWLR